MSALFAAGSRISVVDSSDFAPHTSGYRLLYLFNSLVGMSVMSLTLTYLMQVYSALHRRNALGLQLHLAASGPPTPQSSSRGLAPVLFYFRFRQPFYAVSSICLLSLDAVTFIDGALDRRTVRLVATLGGSDAAEGGVVVVDDDPRGHIPTERLCVARPAGRARARSLAAAV